MYITTLYIAVAGLSTKNIFFGITGRMGMGALEAPIVDLHLQTIGLGGFSFGWRVIEI
jgi:hypothetical protein